MLLVFPLPFKFRKLLQYVKFLQLQLKRQNYLISILHRLSRHRARPAGVAHLLPASDQLLEPLESQQPLHRRRPRQLEIQVAGTVAGKRTGRRHYGRLFHGKARARRAAGSGEVLAIFGRMVLLDQVGLYDHVLENVSDDFHVRVRTDERRTAERAPGEARPSIATAHTPRSRVQTQRAVDAFCVIAARVFESVRRQNGAMGTAIKATEHCVSTNAEA